MAPCFEVSSIRERMDSLEIYKLLMERCVNYTTIVASVPSNIFCKAIQQNAYDGGFNYSGNKSNYETLFIQHNGWTQGQHIPLVSIL